MKYDVNEPKQVIIVRKDLNMRKGKLAAQVAHASMKVIFDMMSPEYGLFTVKNGGEQYKFQLWLPKGEIGENMYKWITGIFKKIVVGAESLQELTDAYQAAKLAGIPCSIIEDAGLTEFGGNITITAVAIGPDDPEKIDKITGHLNLL